MVVIVLAEPTYRQGLLDTSVVIDLAAADAKMLLPEESLICTITLAELSYGIALAAEPIEATTRAQRYAQLKTWLSPLPFDGNAADTYGQLAALVLKSGRSPRPRRMDLMIASVACAYDLPLFTLNPDDFCGLESALTVVGPQGTLK